MKEIVAVKIDGKDNPSDLMTKILTLGEIMDRLDKLNIKLVNESTSRPGMQSRL